MSSEDAHHIVAAITSDVAVGSVSRSEDAGRLHGRLFFQKLSVN